MASQVKTVILGGGQGKRLFPLTDYRSKPAVPIGGKYRLVDIPISNSINSGLREMFVLTQFNSTSLHRHIHRAYPYEFFNETSVELLAAEQTTGNTDWFQGTADAVRKHLGHYHLEGDEPVLILSGDHLYRMDYREIIKFHEEQKADVTISTVPVPKKEVSGFGIMRIKKDSTITSFWEKPSPAENIKSFIMPDTIRSTFGVKGSKELYLASMGIYVFRVSVLRKVLEGNETDFGKEVIPKTIQNFKACGYVFNGYWRDIGTIEAFYDANIELTHPKPQFDFLSHNERIFTRARFLPPTRIYSSTIKDVLLTEGCLIEDAKIEQSVVGLRTMIGKDSVIQESIIMGNDFYEDQGSKKQPAIGIGQNCKLRHCIIDKNVRIGNSVTMVNSAKVWEKDGDNYYIRDGIIIIPKGAVITDGTKI